MKYEFTTSFEVNELIHTGLRKGSSTPYSALAWNVLHLIDGDVKMRFFEALRVQLNKIDDWNDLETLKKHFTETAADPTWKKTLYVDASQAASSRTSSSGSLWAFNSIEQLFKCMDDETASDLACWGKTCIEAWMP